MLSSRRVEPGYVLGALLVALSGLAWAVLWVWERAPAGHDLDHHSLDAARDDPRLIPLFVAGWIVMVVAMMLPTQLPTIVTLQRNARYESPIRFGALLVGGYLAAWALYGVAVYAGNWLLHQVLAALPLLQRQAWAFGALSLIVAGAYQFTPAKRSLLRSLHAGRDGSARQGHARTTAAQAIMLGLQRGFCCIGCCWSLMLLMFGAGRFGGMLTLAAIMALENNVAWGRRLVAPLGLTLVASGVWIVLLAAPASGHAGHMP